MSYLFSELRSGANTSYTTGGPNLVITPKAIVEGIKV
jgi:hypothetical protein